MLNLQNETMKTLLHRRSNRKYRNEAVPQEAIDAIIEAGRYAPSAMNKQPVRFIETQDPTWIKRLSKMNAAVMNSTGDPFYGAPAVICVLADTTSSNWVKDGSLAMGNMMNAAYALGLGSCWINRCEEMFATEEGQAILRSLGLPESVRGIGCLIVGYADDEPVAKPRIEHTIYHL